MRALFLALGLLLALPSPPALAQPKKLSAKERQEASQAFSKAEAAFEAQDFSLALSLYQRAYQISLRPELHFNIGQCQRKLGQDEEALTSYRAFLAALPETPLRPDVEALIAELEAKKPAPVEAFAPPVSASALLDAPRSTKLFLAGGAGATAALLTASFGLRAALSSSRLEDEGRFAQSREQRERALAFGLASDVLFLSSLAAIGYGYTLRTREMAEPAPAPAPVSLLASPLGVGLSLRF